MPQRGPAKGGVGLAPGRVPNGRQALDLLERPRLPSGQDVERALADYARTSRGGATVSSVQNAAYDVTMEARFAVAARHSRLVRMLRIAVPAAVGLALALIVLKSYFLNPFKEVLKLPVDIEGVAVSGTKVTMESPHLSGFTQDQRPYEVWAKSAVQDVTDPDHVELRTLRAKILMEDQSTVTLDARTGMLDNKQQTLDLHKDIFLQTSTGYEARLSQAFVDMGKGTVTSDEHVDVKLTNGTLTSDRLRITGGGEVVRFEGNVVMHLDHLDATNAPADSNTARTADAVPPPRPRAAGSGKSGNSK
jgi:lipopolysaccharide export system protein LptC